MKASVLDLFSGCGGMSSGFESTGFFEIRAANEFWEPACKTWEMNHSGTMVRGDITDKNTQDAIVHACGGKIDVLIGGVPCVAFSMSGKRDPNDKRGKLFEEYIHLVSRLKPKVCVIENVVGIKSMIHSEGPVPEIIKSRLRKCGYETGHRTLLASDYVVPQDRERVFFVGTLMGHKPLMWPSWPSPTHGDGLRPKNTVRLAIGDLDDMPDDKIFSHIRVKHSKDFLEKISQTQVGSSVTKNFRETFLRISPDSPCPTVKANNGSVFVHYKSNRCVTPRELARLQDFPDNFLFYGSKHDVLVQIGNAVPVGLAREVGFEVYRILSGCPTHKKEELLFEMKSC